MVSYNLFNILKVNIADDVSYFAKKCILESNTIIKCHDKTAYKHYLNIKKLTPKLEQSLSTNTLVIDIFQYLDNNKYLEKCKYKFSEWKFLLYIGNESNTWNIAVKGDFYSNFVWPYRTLDNLIKLILGMYNCYFIHAASFYTKNGAILIIAPSGTGKTLTALHWLCDGGKFYSDDTSVILNNKVLFNTKSISFWAYRYKNNKNALPLNFPNFTIKDKTKALFYKALNNISFKCIGFSTRIKIDKYFPDSKASPSAPQKIISFKRGSKFSVNYTKDKEIIINRLIGDFMFQGLPVLKWLDVMTLFKGNIINPKEYLDNYIVFINKLIRENDVYEVIIPENYSRELYNKIKKVIIK
jgi:hypothetical protein